MGVGGGHDTTPDFSTGPTPGPPRPGGLEVLLGLIVVGGGGADGEKTVNFDGCDEAAPPDLCSTESPVVDQVVEARSRNAQQKGGFEDWIGGSSLNIHDLPSGYGRG